jgi:hypothetical protein
VTEPPFAEAPIVTSNVTSLAQPEKSIVTLAVAIMDVATSPTPMGKEPVMTGVQAAPALCWSAMLVSCTAIAVAVPSFVI